VTDEERADFLKLAKDHQENFGKIKALEAELWFARKYLALYQYIGSTLLAALGCVDDDLKMLPEDYDDIRRYVSDSHKAWNIAENLRMRFREGKDDAKTYHYLSCISTPESWTESFEKRGIYE
jgi:hypothetical protein